MFPAAAVDTDRCTFDGSAGAFRGAGRTVHTALTIENSNATPRGINEMDVVPVAQMSPMKRQKPDTLKSFLQANAGCIIDPNDAVDQFGCLPVVKQAFAASLNSFMCALECSCESLAGEDDTFQDPECDVLYVARNEMCHEMETVLSYETCNRAALVEACRTVYKKYAVSEVRKRKTLVSAYVDGIEALTLIAASSNRVEAVSAVISKRFESVKRVCSCPPRALLECMAKYGISSAFLAVMFDHCGPSIGKKAAMLSQYLGPSAWKLHNACIEANAVLQEQLALSVDDPFWYQIVVDCRDPGQLCLTGDDVCTVFPPPHCAYKRNVCIKRRPCRVGAVRVLRFLKAVQLCVEVGFVSNMISTDYLLATCGMVGEPASGHSSHKPEWVPPCTSKVPDELKRDLNILIAIEKCLPRGAGDLEVGVMTDMLMQKGAFSHGSTRRSVEQAVHHVMRKSAHQILKRFGDECGIAYVKSDKPQCTIGHLVMDAAGSARMRMRVREIVECICSPSKKVRSEWRASRSSRSVAAAARRDQCIAGVDVS
tara:strand:+ start:958 stop:2577 length:1620 start_codon:yes stop_codon:yes gene_type:complete